MDQGSPPTTPMGLMDSRAKRPRTSVQGVEMGSLLDTRKRRRGEGGEEFRNPSSPNPATTIARTPEEFEEVRQKSQILFDKLMNHRDPYDPTRPLYAPFLDLPPAELTAYYAMIKKPISLNEIKAKLDSHSYNCLLDAKTDMNQIFVNAKRFNAPGSDIFLDAKKLHKVLKSTYAVLTGEAPPPDEEEPQQQPVPSLSGRRGSSAAPSAPPPLAGIDFMMDDHQQGDSGSGGGGGGTGPNGKRGPTLKPWLLKKFGELTRLTDEHGRTYADVFRALPDKREWADYYSIITHPVSLDNVNAKINARKYQNVEQFRQDVETCFENAVFFNEEHSRIWEDAKIMLNHFAQVMQERPPEFAPPRKYNTVRRRREAEEAARRQGRAMSSQPPMGGGQGQGGGGMNGGGGGGQEKAEMSDNEEDESGNDSEGGGYDSAYPNDSFVDPYDPSTTYGTSPITATLGLGAPGIVPPSLATIPSQPNNALASFAAFATSNPVQAPLSAPIANGVPAIVIPRPRPLGPIEPKPLAKMISPGEVPLITRFTVSCSPSTSTTFSLDNTSSRQHSISIPPSTSRLDITLSLRKHRIDGSIIDTKGKRKLNNDQRAEEEEEAGFYVSPSITVSSRPIGTTSVETLPVEAVVLNSGGTTPTKFLLVPRKGLTVCEFSLGVGDGNTTEEVYRLFITR